jgi:hypothetical protein
MHQPPIARVLAVEEIGSTLAVTLCIKGLIHPPLAPSSLHPVTESDQTLIELHRVVDRTHSQVTFHCYNNEANGHHLSIGETYVFRTWWTPNQLALAHDIDRLWKRQTFKPIDAVQTVLPGGPRLLRPFRANENIDGSDPVVHAGWDHEHCALCWQRISALEGDEPTGYSSEGEWICGTCYQRYIKQGFGQKLG